MKCGLIKKNKNFHTKHEKAESALGTRFEAVTRRLAGHSDATRPSDHNFKYAEFAPFIFDFDNNRILSASHCFQQTAVV